MNKVTMKSSVDSPLELEEYLTSDPDGEDVQTHPESRRISLGVKLALAFILLISAALLITMVLSIQLTRTSLTNILKERLVAQTGLHAESTRSYLIWTRSFAVDLAANMEANEYNKEQMLATLQRSLTRNEQIFGTTVAFEPYQFEPELQYWSPYYNRLPNGDLQFTQLGNANYNYLQQTWYALPKAKRVPILSSPYFDEGGGNIWMVTWSVPFYSKEGKFQGVATADIAFSQTQEFIRQIPVGQKGYAFLINNRGQVLGVGDNGGTYRTMTDTILMVEASDEAVRWNSMVQSMIESKTGFVDVIDPQGREMFVAYAPIGMDTGWSLGLAYPQSELFQPANQLAQRLGFLAVGILTLASLIVLVLSRYITRPVQEVANQAKQFIQERTGTRNFKPIEINTNDELQDLGSSFNQMATELIRTLESLEFRVDERTSELSKSYAINERRAKQFEAISQVSRVINRTQGLQDLLPQITQVIGQQFNFYHVGIFLIDVSQEYAVLVAANSEGGERMLARNHRLKVGQTGIVGTAAGNGIPRIALDTGADAVYFNNPDLPETRSEMALPLLKSQREIIGVLDVQSTESNAFGPDDIQVLSTLAEQVSIAITNARLYEETQKSIIEAEMSYRRELQSGWKRFTRSRKLAGIHHSNMKSNLLTEPMELPGASEVIRTGNTYQKNSTENDPVNEMTLPVRLRGEVVGVLNVKNERGHIWTTDEIDVVSAILERAALAIENSRLLAESRKSAEKERLIGEITTRVSSYTNRDNILQTAVTEIGRILPGAEVAIQIQSSEENGKHS